MTSSDGQDSTATNTPGLPLYQSIKAIKKALEKIITADPRELKLILGPLVDSKISSSSSSSSFPAVLRLEQTVSHSVDPLGWLYAQNKRQLATSANHDNNKQKDPLFYIQSTVESAVFGAAWTWDKPTNTGPNKHQFWNMMSSLPQDSYIYGGERFDQGSSDNTNRRDWKDFGCTWWVLPAVELREEPAELVVAPAANNDDDGRITRKRTTLAIHLVTDPTSSTSDNPFQSWQTAARETLQLLQRLSDAVTDAQVPTTTLPPVIFRQSTYVGPGGNEIDGQDLYERGVTAALDAFSEEKTDSNPDDDAGDGKAATKLKKVVLARRMDLQFEADLSALDILRKWKYNEIHEGGNMFYLRPSGQEEFFGCTPERLFTIQKNSNMVLTEALAGTRPRGTSAAADNELMRDLFGSLKDRSENAITADFIRGVFAQLGEKGLVETTKTIPSKVFVEDKLNEQLSEQNQTETATATSTTTSASGYFVRRLRHLQHICQRFSAELSKEEETTNSKTVVKVVEHLLANLHPTPAVGGFPASLALDFIRQHETVGFDRGFYAGPVGYMGRNAADILVAIRSGLVTQSIDDPSQETGADLNNVASSKGPKTKVSVYAGAGLVPGSTVQGEWAETSYKLGVISSLFPQSPVTLQSASTPNVAWANAFIEELIRNGITQFYVCPGSRSTPLVVAISKAARSNVGVVHAVSVHDERGAGFRAVGYGRGANRPAAVITSSGTAIANLYPAIVEAGMDGVPMLVLTADRPYENRDTGANQAIDQIKAYSSSYIRWFRDILPPHDDVPVSVALADASHAVSVARSQRGPVHINMQFRENLAPEGGAIRSDNRAGSVSRFNGFRFTDVPGFSRWSTSGDRWLKSYAMSSADLGLATHTAAVVDVARLIMNSKRGIIVVGNLRRQTDENDMEALATLYDVIADFAQAVGFPVIAGAQNAHLRFSCPAVIPFAEHILKNPTVAQNIKPDLIIQIGAPLVSTEVPTMIDNALRAGDSSVHHVLLHPHHGSERADPNFTVSRKISAEIAPFLKALSTQLDATDLCRNGCSSQLSPLVRLGKRLQTEMSIIINNVSQKLSPTSDDGTALTEPQIVLALSMMMSNSAIDQSLFLSNSMPVRDAEFFLYPTREIGKNSTKMGALNVGTNRGASGIDGIIASATGFSESTGTQTTLLIGDLAALHDLNSFHALTSGTTSSKHPLTTILVNNDGGGIFSFLPIAKHGADVSFETFFGTPTNTLSYQQASEAFGLRSRQVSRFDSLCLAYAEAARSNQSSVIEAQVVPREQNVAVHRQITAQVNSFIDGVLQEDSMVHPRERVPLKFYANDDGNAPTASADTEKKNVMVLIHGWMGDKTEWDDTGPSLAKLMGEDWQVLAVDLRGHGASRMMLSSDNKAIRSALRINPPGIRTSASIDEMARSVLLSLSRDHGVTQIDALAGYSLGGRVALAMKRLCSVGSRRDLPGLVKDTTKMVLLSTYPGVLPQQKAERLGADTSSDDLTRMSNDDRLSRALDAWSNRCDLTSSPDNLWADFLQSWYGMPMWGDFKEKDHFFKNMIRKRKRSLAHRGRDIAEVLRQCSPPRNSKDDWRGVHPERTLFLAGSRDSKYVETGKLWKKQGVLFAEVAGSGHALLVEASDTVASEMADFILSDGGRGAEKVVARAAATEQGNPSSNIASDLTEQSSNRAESGAEERRSISEKTGAIGSFDFDPFMINVVDESQQQKGVFGIGWGDQAKKSNQMTNRSGFILQLVSAGGSKAGVGEVSPLPGLHKESLADAEAQLMLLKDHFENSSDEKPEFSVPSLLALDGALGGCIKDLARRVGLQDFSPSVRSGLEMALISLASQKAHSLMHQALVDFAPAHSPSLPLNAPLPVNGLITRGSDRLQEARKRFPSLKVKVGHQEDIMEDAAAVSNALQQSDFYRGPTTGVIRADANRAWDHETAIEFASALAGTDIKDRLLLEFVEEPLQRQDPDNWTIGSQVAALERWYKVSGIPYGLDESLADLAQQHDYDFSSIREELVSSFGDQTRGCAAFVLKPALIGLELSMQMARFARNQLGIGVSFSSSFDSGVGLAYTAMLGAISDATGGDTKRFSHGVGTFTMLDGDTLSPSFGSYVNENGLLNIISLSRALNGLGLDELRDSHVFFELPGAVPSSFSPSPALDSVIGPTTTTTTDENYEVSTATSSSGREINLLVSLPLPFSADIACTRFTDFPQQSRWSPWIRSVRYLDDGRETEWTLNVRGVQFKWRAVSTLLETPLKGIQWESIDGLKNKGIVEFVETGENSALMKVRMSIMTPRILASIFQSTSIFVEDFLQNKLLKWSLEMFRDVVRSDLALERGDVELGDALFSSVEGKASAIEATLSMPTSIFQKDANKNINGEESNS